MENAGRDGYFTRMVGGGNRRSLSSADPGVQSALNRDANNPRRLPSPSRLTSTRDLAGQHQDVFTTSGIWNNGTEEELDNVAYRTIVDDEQSWWTELPAHLQPPHQALTATRVQHPLPDDPSLPPRYQRECFKVIPKTNAWEFYEQRKEMIARHHWKLTNQDMTSWNALRCIRMLMKHQWTLLEFIRNLEQEGQTKQELLDWLIREHAVLLETSTFVLSYFHLIRMPLMFRQLISSEGSDGLADLIDKLHI